MMQTHRFPFRTRVTTGLAVAVLAASTATVLIARDDIATAQADSDDGRGRAEVTRTDLEVDRSADGVVTYASTVTLLHRDGEVIVTAAAVGVVEVAKIAEVEVFQVRPDTAAAGGEVDDAPTGDAGGGDRAGGQTGGATTGDATGGAAAQSAGRTRLVTAIPEISSVLQAGDVLYRVDDEPVVLLDGAVALERALASGDVGDDVEALERNLAALGFDPDGAMTLDDTFTSATAAAVLRWQEAVGLDVTGTVALGTVAFTPTPARVAASLVSVGDLVQDGDEAVVVTSLARGVTFTAPAADAGTLAVGDVVSARLPDRTLIDVRVIALAPSAAGDGTVSISAVPSSDEAELPVLEETPITVSWSRTQVAGALVVPTAAIVRRDLGGHAVEVVGQDGVVRFVEVEVGPVSGTSVVVTAGLLQPGDLVVVP